MNCVSDFKSRILTADEVRVNCCDDAFLIVNYKQRLLAAPMVGGVFYEVCGQVSQDDPENLPTITRSFAAAAVDALAAQHGPQTVSVTEAILLPIVNPCY